MTNSVVVRLKDYLSVMKLTRVGKKLGKRNIKNESVKLYFSDSTFRFRLLDVEQKIPANGAWDGVVAIPLEKYMLMTKAGATQDPLRISYDTERGTLIIGSLRLPAEWTKLSQEEAI